jgi:hypothetical protein
LTLSNAAPAERRLIDGTEDGHESAARSLSVELQRCFCISRAKRGMPAASDSGCTLCTGVRGKDSKLDVLPHAFD